jgi:hypothetical protein
MKAEETGGVESGEDLESFAMKSKMPRGRLLFDDITNVYLGQMPNGCDGPREARCNSR